MQVRLPVFRPIRQKGPTPAQPVFWQTRDRETRPRGEPVAGGRSAARAGEERPVVTCNSHREDGHVLRCRGGRRHRPPRGHRRPGRLRSARLRRLPRSFLTRAPDGSCCAFSTQVGGLNVPMMRSTDLATWTTPTDALPRLPAWAAWGHTWASSVARRGSMWGYEQEAVRLPARPLGLPSSPDGGATWRIAYHAWQPATSATPAADAGRCGSTPSASQPAAPSSNSRPRRRLEERPPA